MIHLPKEVQEAVGRGRLEPVSRGESEDRVFRVPRSDGRDAYLKVGTGERRTELRREHEVLSWLAGRLRAPKIETYLEWQGHAYLVTSAVPGHPASEMALGPETEVILVELGRALQGIHSTMPVETCPFDRRLSAVVTLAHRRAEKGRVDLDHLDEDRRGWTVERLLRELDRSVPGPEDPVFTHGDFSLPNVLLQGGRVRGVVDWGRWG